MSGVSKLHPPGPSRPPLSATLTSLAKTHSPLPSCPRSYGFLEGPCLRTLAKTKQECNNDLTRNNHAGHPAENSVGPAEGALQPSGGAPRVGRTISSREGAGTSLELAITSNPGPRRSVAVSVFSSLCRIQRAI